MLTLWLPDFFFPQISKVAFKNVLVLHEGKTGIIK